MNEYRQTTAAVHNLADADHYHSVRVGVVVPLLQAFITGLLVAIIVAIVCLWNALTDWYYWCMLSAALIVFGQWTVNQMVWRRIVRQVERIAQIDIDRDGVIPPVETPPAPPQTMRVEVTEKRSGFVQTNIIDLPYGERVPRMAEMLAAGKALTVANFVGQSRGRLFSPAEFVEMRNAMLQHGWIRANNPHDETRGYALTRTGTQVMNGLNTSPSVNLDASWTRVQ